MPLESPTLTKSRIDRFAQGLHSQFERTLGDLSLRHWDPVFQVHISASSRRRMSLETKILLECLREDSVTGSVNI